MSSTNDFQDLIAKATSWVAKQNRSKFGSMAVSEDSLVLFAAWRLSEKSERCGEAVSYGLQMGYLDLVKSCSSPESYAVEAEYNFWINAEDDTHSGGWSYSNKDASSYLVDPSEIGEFMGRLHQIHKHPELIRYFEANIWDIDVIERCIADGIDRDIAARLVRV